MAIDTQDKSFPGSSGTSAAGSGMSAGGSSGYGGGTAGTGGGSGGSPGGQGVNQQVQRVAQGAHQTVDKVEQTLTSGTEKLMSMQQEYGEMARERVNGNPLAAVGIAFAAGILFSEIVLPGSKSHPMRRASDFEEEERRERRTERLGRGLRQFMDLQHGPLHDVADTVSDAAHRLERGLGHGSKRLAQMQHEYGDIAVDQIRAHPLLLLGVGVGVCAAVLKLFDDSY